MTLIFKLMVWHKNMPEPHVELFTNINDAIKEQDEWINTFGKDIQTKIIY